MARPKCAERSVRLSVTLDEDDYRALRELAESCGLSVAWMMRRAAAEFVARHDKDDVLMIERRGEDRAA
ncbi:MAG: CopG family transcriptional regulator [Hyphomicrobiaceae bacterium]|nr:CopG family transcriptional regulator [Hyphomicrobiaceae bacterium]